MSDSDDIIPCSEWLRRILSRTVEEKRSLEEKLERSERRCEGLCEMLERSDRRCEGLDENVKKLRQKKSHLKEELDRIRTTCEDLQQKVIKTTMAVDELRVKKTESEKAALLYKRRVDELEPRVLKVEAALAKVLDVNLADLEDALDKLNMSDFVENLADTGDADGNGGTNEGTRKQTKEADVDHPYVRGYACVIHRVRDEIKEKLKTENLEKFQQSCFGHLLEIGELNYQGMVLMQLLMHMDMAASSKECLVFNIKKSRVEFGPRDFSLVTGLCLGTLEGVVAATSTISSSSSIREKIFNGKSSIFLRDIEDCFARVRDVGKSGDERPLKLALLYFLYGSVLSHRSSRQVDQQYLPLIEDLEVFNAFPWGRVAYEFLALSMLSARKHIDDYTVSCSKTIDIEGFSLALQVWAYELMPPLAAYCAVLASNDPIQQILRWTTQRKTICSKHIEKFFTPGDEALSASGDVVILSDSDEDYDDDVVILSDDDSMERAKTGR